ncbi:AI-2E family transporter [Synechococcus elongatus IITB7]|uniref:AI-2E family transporter n=1 Tax=Synechococcus elongatus TaxID=32046 RepID=UPI0030CB334A
MRLGQWLGFTGILAAAYILWQLRQVMLLLFAAVVLAVIINHLARQLQQRLRWSRRLSLTVTLLGLTVVGGLLVALLMPPLLVQFQDLLELAPQGFAKLLDWVEERLVDIVQLLPGFSDDRSARLFVDSAIRDLIQSFGDRRNWTSFSQQLGPLARNFLSVFNNTVVAAAQLLLIVVLTLMMLSNPQSYRQTFLRLLPSFYRRRADEILNACEISLSDWFLGILISSSAIALFSWVGLMILGVKLALVNAIIAGFLNLIPNLGPTLSAVFPISVVLLDEPWKAWAVLVLYIIIQQLESYWLTPTIMARQVSLLPALTLIAQIVFASIFGLAGLILALPLAVVAKVFCEQVLIHDVLDRWQHLHYFKHPEWIGPHPESAQAAIAEAEEETF